MDEGWIKLHRKVLSNGILRDQSAWTIFSWLMLKVDRKTGKKIIGRFWASEELGMNPSTFYKALKRLEKKWQMVTLSSNNKYTEISLINWVKYQSGNSDSNNQVTTKEQQSNTLQEVKKIRIKNNTNVVATAVAENLNHLINLFKGVNPNYELVFSNKTERAALQRQVDKFSFSRIENLLNILPGIVAKPYAPRITKPTELERKMGQLIIFLNQEKKKNPGIAGWKGGK